MKRDEEQRRGKEREEGRRRCSYVLCAIFTLSRIRLALIFSWKVREHFVEPCFQVSIVFREIHTHIHIHSPPTPPTHTPPSGYTTWRGAGGRWLGSPSTPNQSEPQFGAAAGGRAPCGGRPSLTSHSRSRGKGRPPAATPFG